jgi:hypothetical protein
MNLKPYGSPVYDIAIPNNVIGTGWQLDEKASVCPDTWDSFRSLAEKIWGKRGRWRIDVGALENSLAINDLVWIYNKEDSGYYLGRITSGWRYTTLEPFHSRRLNNVRDCEWVKIPRDVPGAVQHSRATIKELRELSVHSATLFDQYTPGEFKYGMMCEAVGSLWNYLGPEEVEDAVAFYLQSKLGYSIVPSTCKHSTPDVEFQMIHRETGEQAALQVKSGKAKIDCARLSNLGMKVYAFSISDSDYSKASSKVIRLSPSDVEAFLRVSIATLPAVLKHWVQHTIAK